MSFSDWSNKKKKKDNTSNKTTTSFSNWSNSKYGITEEEENSALSWRSDEIAPVKEEKRSWFQKGAFEDGYQFGDLTKTIVGTVHDINENINEAIFDATENLIDTTAYGVGAIGGLFNEDFKDDVGEFIAKEILKPKESGEAVATYGSPTGWLNLLVNSGDTEGNSVLGDKSDGLVQSGSHLVGSYALQMVGVPAWLTMGVNAFGSEIESAFQNDATYLEAGISGGISAAAEIVFERISSGIKFGKGGTWDDGVQKWLKNNISNKIGRSLAKYGVDTLGEGLEEVATEYTSALGKKLTYMDDKEFNEIISTEDAFDAFIGGFVMGGVAGSGRLANSAKTGRDYVTGLNDSEDKVVNKLYEDTIAEQEKGGTKLTQSEKNKIYDKIVEQMDKGEIDIDTIESVLGGKTYEQYKSITEKEKALTDEISQLESLPNEQITVKQKERLLEARKELANLTGKTELKAKLSDEVYGIAKDSRLVESYDERARKGQAFEADLSQYKGKQKDAVERAVKSGVLNNTRRSHELVNILSKIEADKGIVFDYADNAKLKESGFAIEGKTVNAFVNKSKGAVTLNIQSQKAWQSTVGHEITHILEGTKHYETLQQALFKYAESKGELESRRANLTELYTGINADIDAELTADLVGDYLFNDSDFVKNLTTNKNLFQKIYDEIKYLYNVATGKEKAEIAKVQREFEKAWEEFSLNESILNEATDTEIDDVKYSIAVEDKKTLDFLNEQVSRGEYNAETNPDGGYYVTYKSMSYWGTDENGNAILRSPMAEYVDGELSNAYLIPKDKSKLNWYQATETIDENTGLPSGLMVKTKKEGNKTFSYLPAAENQDLIAEDWSNLYFNLQKKVLKNGKWVKSDVPARYNPYEHSSNSMLNDQFSAAYLRDNLVTVKMYVPISEDNGTFRAQYSKDATGWADWKTGTVAGKINKQKDLQRKVYLSRYAAPVEIVSDSEVAQAYKEYLDGTDVTIPDNVVSPNLLNELKKAGVPIEESGKVKYSVSEDSKVDSVYAKAVESGNTEVAQKILDETAKKAGYDIKAYHGTGYDFTVFDKSRQGDNYENWGRLGKGFYFAPTSREAETWAELSKGGKNKVMPVYLRSENMIDSFEALPDDLKDTIPENWDSLTRRLAEKYAYNYIEYMQEFGYNVQEILTEKGYDGINGHTEFVVFDSEQVKSADPVTYDNDGNAIPLSERFNPDNVDIRYSLSPEGEQSTTGAPLNEMYLAPTKEDVAENTTTTEAVEDVAPMPSDADAPPEMVDDYYSMPDTTAIDVKTLNNIGKTLRDTLYLTPQETKAIQEIVQEYSTSENPNAYKLFKTIKEQFGEKIARYYNQELADVKRELRTTKIFISDEIKKDIADYRDVIKEVGGRLAISNDGIGVDKQFEILAGEHPEYFDLAKYNTQTDRFLRMVAVAKESPYQYRVDTLDDEVIQDAVNIVLNEVRGYKENLTRIAAEETAKEAIDSIAPLRAEQLTDGSRGDALLNQSLDNYPIETVEDRLKEKIRAVQGELEDNKVLRREATQNYDKQIAELSEQYLNLKNQRSKKANDIVRRIARLEDLKASNDANYAKRISDLEARLEKMNTEQYNRAMHKQDKMTEHADWAANLLGDTSTWVDKKIGLQYATNTERRNLRDIIRDENGNKDIAKADAIDDALNGQYNREEAALKRELAQVRKKYADLKITKAEDTYIQMLGEFKGNPETELTEKEVNEYYERHKNKIDVAKVEKVIELARQDYDNLLQRVNEALRSQGMKEIPYRQGYFPHFTEPKQNFIQKLLNWKTQDTEIPTSIAGLTEDFKPVKKYQSFDKQRHGDTTDYSFLKGFDTYSQGALDWIYHLDTLQKRRAVENHIRFTHSDEGIQKRIKEVYANEELDANEAQAQIEHILSEAKNPLNNFVQDFTTHTNILTGKKNSYDRTTEQAFNRKIYSTMLNVQNRLSANMVLANVRSALTNFIPITQSWAQVSPMRSLQATKDTIANAIKDDGTIDKSTFLTNRLKNPDNLYKTNWDKVLDGAGIMFEIVDNFSSQVIWRSKYNQNLAKGMSESQAIANADQFAESVMAGRSKGNEPTLFNAKNPFVKAFTMFQLEVNNQYGYLFKDVPTDLKTETKHWKFNLAKGYTTAFVGAYIYDALLTELTGSGAAFNPIGIIEDLLRDLGLFDEEEEKEPAEIVTNLASNVVEELPFVGGLLGGGRIPISSALPYGGEYGGGFKGAVEDISEGNWKNIGKEMMNPILNIGLPVGGGQIKKTVQGLKMYNTDEEHPVAGSYTDSGALRFPVEDTLGNRIKSGIFGQWANDNAREYLDNGYAPLKEKQIQEYVDVDLPIADYWKYREGLTGLKKNAEKADYINSLDIEDWQKNLLLNNILDRKEDVDMSNYDDYADFEEFDYAQKNPEKYAFAKSVGGYSAYKTYSEELYDIKADKDESGKSITGSRKEKVIDYINGLDATYEEKIVLFKSEYPADDTYNEEIINYLNNRADLTYEELVAIYTELGFTVKDGYVYWD